MNQNDSTHVVLNDERVVISPNLVDTFLFLTEIEKEIEILIGYNEKIQKIRQKFECIFNDFCDVAKIIEDKNIGFQYKSTKKDMTIVDDFNVLQLPRSQIICLFAFMETIFCLITVYEYELSDEREIIEKSNDNLNKLIEKCILTKKNEFYNKNINRLKKINAGQLKILRNSLTHFYSVSDSIGVIPNGADDDARKVEKHLENQKHNYVFFTPDDFYALLKGAVKIILLERTEESMNDSKNFKRKMIYVVDLISKKGAKLMKLNSKSN